VRGGEQYISLPGEMHDTGSQPQDKGIMYWLILDVTKERNKFLFLAPDMARNLISDLLQLPSRHFAAASDSAITLENAFKALCKIKKPDEGPGIFENAGPAKSLSVGGRKSNRSGSKDFLQVLEATSQIVYYILQTIAASRASHRSVSPVIQTSLDFIAKNEEVWLSVGQVAETINLSESHFKILFREEVGLPPAEYMLRQKVEAAKRALSKPNCNITELAYRLGFSSSQYFATVFKRYTSQTPSEFMGGQDLELIEIAN
jgi:AraC-like DNA-binding protein